jgi:hypothetical protein
MEFALHQRLHREQNRPVNVVQQVQRRKQDKRGPGIKFRLGHLPKEYSTAVEGLVDSSSDPHFPMITLDVINDNRYH